MNAMDVINKLRPKKVFWWSNSMLPFFVISTTLALSLIVFNHNAKYQSTMHSILGVIGFIFTGFSSEFILTMVFLLLLVYGLWNARALWLSLYLSWFMFIFSVLYYGDLNWLIAKSDVDFFHTFSNDLGAGVVMINGIVLVAADLYFRSWQQAMKRKRGLVKRGAPKEELDIAIDRNMRFITLRVCLAAVMATAVGLAAWYLAPAVRPLTDIIVGNMFSVIGLAFTIALLAFLLYQLWLRDDERHAKVEKEAEVK
ncbi:MAG: hypothetical protein A4E32_01173 [Methanomassiliicoccales archaeon PtaU1.Bin124]|nr:MAG: hypothetical protein A4E32_01173 [Methanomassiliicoccales archaeon PtaU1.Bin124]